MQRKLQNIISNSVPVFVFIGIFLVWTVLSEGGIIPGYMLPTPISVIKAFITDFPLLMSHAKVTLVEAFVGMAIGTSLGFLFAAWMDAYVLVRKGLYPIIILTQTIPTVAIAPLLLLWFSYGMLPKIILVVSISFFPIAVGVFEGFQSVDDDMIKLMKSMGASKFQIFWHVKVPAALNEFYSGLKMSVAYSIVGAVIAEWLGGFEGLGVYMTRVKKSYSYDKMFAVIFLISVISLILMWVVKVIQKKTMPWEYKKEKTE